MTKDMNWDDLKFFLAVSRLGSIRSAAQHLGVNHATVSRRINQFEQAVGKRLFERTPGGYIRTSVADQIYEEAHHLEERLNTFSRRIMGGNDELSGDIRVTLPQLLGEGFLMPAFAAFCERYPAVELEVLAAAELFNLSNREADVAFRICHQPPEYLIGKKLVSLHRACYISNKKRTHMLDPEWLAKQHWIGWSDKMRRPIGKVARDYPGFKSKHKILEANLQASACEHGLGIAVLPCFIGDPNPNLVRIPPYVTEAKYDLWLLSHPDLRKNAKIQQFVRFMVDAVESLKPLLMGQLYRPIDD